MYDSIWLCKTTLDALGAYCSIGWIIGVCLFIRVALQDVGGPLLPHILSNIKFGSYNEWKQILKLQLALRELIAHSSVMSTYPIWQVVGPSK